MSANVTEINWPVLDYDMQDWIESAEKVEGKSYDHDASLRAFCEVLEREIRAAYPGAEVETRIVRGVTSTISYGDQPKIDIEDEYPGGDAERDVIQAIGDIERGVWERDAEWLR